MQPVKIVDKDMLTFLGVMYVPDKTFDELRRRGEARIALSPGIFAADWNARDAVPDMVTVEMAHLYPCRGSRSSGSFVFYGKDGPSSVNAYPDFCFIPAVSNG